MPNPQQDPPTNAQTASPTTISTTSWTCPECNSSFLTLSGYNKHIKGRQARGTCPQRPTRLNRTCEKCNRGFSSGQSLRRHEQESLRRGICPGLQYIPPWAYQCTKCKLRFNTRTSLTVHIYRSRRWGKCPGGRGRRGSDSFISHDGGESLPADKQGMKGVPSGGMSDEGVDEVRSEIQTRTEELPDRNNIDR